MNPSIKIKYGVLFATINAVVSYLATTYTSPALAALLVATATGLEASFSWGSNGQPTQQAPATA